MHKLSRFVIIFSIAIFGFSFTASNGGGKYFQIVKNLEIYSNIYKELNTYYVDDIDPSKLMMTGVDAMLKSLDPFTNYFSEAEIEKYRFMTEGKYHGIGAIVKKIDGKLTVWDEFKDSPAYKAGIRIGDVLLEVDGQSTDGRTAKEVGEVFKGSPNTNLSMKVKHTDGKVEDLNLVRGEVETENVPHYEVLDGNIGYIVLTTFTKNAGGNVKNALVKLKEKSPDLKGVILDLRSNGGGLLTEAVRLVNIFVPKGELIVETKGKVKDRDRGFKTMSEPLDLDIPLAVMINKNSASASEIVSGSIQDLDRGVIIGQLSYGKGLVQNTKEVGYNTRVKLTTAKYYIPSGRCIQAVNYINGEPVHIAEEDRTPFKTKNNRTVLDGGGITPDVKLKPLAENPILNSLNRDHLIFNFVSEYSKNVANVEDAKNFKFTDFAAFETFLSKNISSLDAGLSTPVSKLKEAIEKSDLDMAGQIDALEKSLNEKKLAAVKLNKDQILNTISNQIVTRHHFQKGKHMNNLKNDPEIIEAKAILLDDSRYNSILAKK